MKADETGGHHIFNFDLNFVSLFETWKVLDVIDLTLVLFLTVSLAVGLEVVKWTKIYALSPRHTETRLYLIGLHCFKAFLQCVQMTMSYLLMLLIMKGHIWIWITMVLGGALGYFLCGWTAIRVRKLPKTTVKSPNQNERTVLPNTQEKCCKTYISTTKAGDAEQRNGGIAKFMSLSGAPARETFV
ncbi:uncharacterized protein LOC141900120 [Tubulanus polymorphus]|uniref:uncharacterized protein LOC141900120 n=1 Tax=Tubulanus polymorphus TaxID=672921 RepID=UPI003DA25976